jgi:hypothetical protein
MAITWLDLIVAALLILCGIGTWAAAETAVSYTLHDEAPNEHDFLARESVRMQELKLKSAQEELDATRKKWIEQSLSGTMPDQLSPKIRILETSQLAAEKKVADARRQATHDFEQRNLLFLIKKRSVTFLLGGVAAAASFLIIWIIGSIIAGPLQLKPKWPAAMSVASVVLAPMFGYQTAGVGGAAVIAAVAIVLVSRR